MKVFRVTVILCCVIGYVVDAFIHNTETKYCARSADCPEGECCKVRGWLGFRPGKCVKHEIEGHHCSSETLRFEYHQNKYWGFCPCLSGLHCMVKEPGEPLRNATYFNIYNVCLSRKSIEIITRELGKKNEKIIKESSDEDYQPV